MESYLRDRIILGQLIFVLQAVGDFFLFLPRFCGVARRYVVSGGLQGAENSGGIEHVEEVMDKKFACEARGLIYVDRKQCLTEGLKKSFEHFHEFTLNCGAPIGTILMLARSTCRQCNGKLLVEANGDVVVFYHIYFGSYLGSRVKKSEGGKVDINFDHVHYLGMVALNVQGVNQAVVIYRMFWCI